MEAKIKNNMDVTIIRIQGTLDIEHTQGFKSVALNKLKGQKVVFNMAEAAFVGSTGIGPFLDTVKELASNASFGVKVVGLNADFQRIFSNLEVSGLTLYDTEARAMESFIEPVPVLPRGTSPVVAD